MKNILFRLGNGIAILLMFWPLHVVSNFKNIKFPIIELFISILYCIYIYSIIIKQEQMKEVKKNYYEFLEFSKKLMTEMSDKEIIKWQEEKIESLLNDFF